jgi:hypothetical protein
MGAIRFILAIAVAVVLSGVVTSYAVLAQPGLPAPIANEQPTTRDAPAVSRTSGERAVEKLDSQLAKKLNVCRGC